MNSFSNIQHFNNLFNEHYEGYVCFAISYVKDRSIAEDFVSEAFTVFWENRANLLPDTKPQAYLLTIVKNKCLNHLQHMQVRQRAEKNMTDHADWLLNTRINTLKACDPEFIYSEEVRQIIDTTLNKLPQKTRQIFEMNRNQGLSYKDIACRLGVTQKAIEFHISKTLRKLRTSLKEFIYLFFLFILWLPA